MRCVGVGRGRGSRQCGFLVSFDGGVRRRAPDPGCNWASSSPTSEMRSILRRHLCPL